MEHTPQKISSVAKFADIYLKLVAVVCWVILLNTKVVVRKKVQ